MVAKSCVPKSQKFVWFFHNKNWRLNPVLFYQANFTFEIYSSRWSFRILQVPGAQVAIISIGMVLFSLFGILGLALRAEENDSPFRISQYFLFFLFFLFDMKIAIGLAKIFCFSFLLIFKASVFFTLKSSSVFSFFLIFRIIWLLKKQLLI